MAIKKLDHLIHHIVFVKPVYGKAAGTFKDKRKSALK
jgi:hypothetical protein